MIFEEKFAFKNDNLGGGGGSKSTTGNEQKSILYTRLKFLGTDYHAICILFQYSELLIKQILYTKILLLSQSCNVADTEPIPNYFLALV